MPTLMLWGHAPGPKRDSLSLANRHQLEKSGSQRIWAGRWNGRNGTGSDAIATLAASEIVQSVSVLQGCKRASFKHHPPF